jgi:hypothetical protein
MLRTCVLVHSMTQGYNASSARCGHDENSCACNFKKVACFKGEHHATCLCIRCASSGFALHCKVALLHNPLHHPRPLTPSTCEACALTRCRQARLYGSVGLQRCTREARRTSLAPDLTSRRLEGATPLVVAGYRCTPAITPTRLLGGTAEVAVVAIPPFKHTWLPVAACRADRCF